MGWRTGLEPLRELRRGYEAGLLLLDLSMPVMDGGQFRFEQRRDSALADIPRRGADRDGLPRRRGPSCWGRRRNAEAARCARASRTRCRVLHADKLVVAKVQPSPVTEIPSLVARVAYRAATLSLKVSGSGRRRAGPHRPRC
jgi:hypothetical protein